MFDRRPPKEIWLRKEKEGDHTAIKSYETAVDKSFAHYILYQHYEDACNDFLRHLNALDIARQYLFRAMAGVGLTRSDVSKVLEAISRELKK